MPSISGHDANAIVLLGYEAKPGKAIARLAAIFGVSRRYIDVRNIRRTIKNLRQCGVLIKDRVVLSEENAYTATGVWLMIAYVRGL